ncbi:MAG: dockerin type I domain-containing protein, partial [Euryarchaeota archaeon]|nr:dockerin type I domain-containing protein [Euryarchaeota archaeon]
TDFCSEYPPGDTAIVAIAGASAQPNNTTTTQITISNMTNLAATTLALYYDPTVVQVTGITDIEDIGILITSIDNVAGESSLSVFIGTPFGLDSPIALANIELRAVGCGGETSPLTLEIVDLFDVTGAMVPATAVSGVFVVNTGPGGALNTTDALVALKLAASGGWDPAMDVNGDGRVTSLDALMILKAAAGAIEL